MKNFQIHFQKFNNITKKLALIHFSSHEVNLRFPLSLKKEHLKPPQTACFFPSLQIDGNDKFFWNKKVRQFSTEKVYKNVYYEPSRCNATFYHSFPGLSGNSFCLSAT